MKKLNELKNKTKEAKRSRRPGLAYLENLEEQLSIQTKTNTELTLQVIHIQRFLIGALGYDINSLDPIEHGDLQQAGHPTLEAIR